MERLASRLAVAVSALEAREFASADAEARQVLGVQPDNVKAREVQSAARLADPEATALLRQWLDDFQRAEMGDRVLMWPSRSFWRRVTAVRAVG